MTVQELIDLLLRVEDKNSDIEVDKMGNLIIGLTPPVRKTAKLDLKEPVE